MDSITKVCDELLMKYLILMLIWDFDVTVCRRVRVSTFREDYRYVKVFDAFFKMHHEALDWHTASIRCEAEGTELIVPQSPDEADAVALLLTDMLSKYEGAYVGLHDLYSERTFVSIRGYRQYGSFVSLQWEPGQPKYKAGRCVAIRRSGRTFVHNCSESLPFICKIHASKVVYNKDCDSFVKALWTKSRNDSNICYMTHAEPQTWKDAYSTCLSAGGRLVQLNHRDEADEIRDLFRQMPERYSPDEDFAFVGFSDLFQQFHYRTVDDIPLKDFGYNEWDVSKCRNTSDGVDRRCGGIRRNGLLTIADCNVPASFFCEKHLVNWTSKPKIPIDSYEDYGDDPTNKPLKLKKKVLMQNSDQDEFSMAI